MRRTWHWYFIVGIVSATVFLVVCDCEGPPVSPKEQAFLDIIGSDVLLDSGLEIAGFAPVDPLVAVAAFHVQNNTGGDLAFPDYEFGVRAYAFDEQNRMWLELGRGGPPAAPAIKLLESGSNEFSETYGSLGIDSRDLGDTREIRLLVIGYSAKLDQGTVIGTKHGAYVDVKVVEGSAPEIIPVTLSPTP